MNEIAPDPESPRRPIPATIAVLIRGDRVLLVRRRNPPDAGRWGFPGGKIEFGEGLEAAVVRELLEETGVSGRCERIFTAVAAMHIGSQGEVLEHYVLVAGLCTWLHGEPVAADDALEARWFDVNGLAGSELALSLDVVRVVEEAKTLTGAVSTVR